MSTIKQKLSAIYDYLEESRTFIVGYNQFIGDAARGLLFPALWPLCQKLGGNQVHQGFLVAMFSFGRAIVTTRTGIMCDQYRHRFTLLFFGVFITIGSLLWGFSPSLGGLPTLFLAQFLLGVGTATLGVSRSYVAERVIPSKRTNALSRLAALQYAGFSMTPLFGAALVILGQSISSFWEYTLPALFLCLLSLINLYLLYYIFKNITKEQSLGLEAQPVIGIEAEPDEILSPEQEQENNQQKEAQILSEVHNQLGHTEISHSYNEEHSRSSAAVSNRGSKRYSVTGRFSFASSISSNISTVSGIEKLKIRNRYSEDLDPIESIPFIDSSHTTTKPTRTSITEQIRIKREGGENRNSLKTSSSSGHVDTSKHLSNKMMMTILDPIRETATSSESSTFSIPLHNNIQTNICKSNNNIDIEATNPHPNNNNNNNSIDIQTSKSEKKEFCELKDLKVTDSSLKTIHDSPELYYSFLGSKKETISMVLIFLNFTTRGAVAVYETQSTRVFLDDFGFNYLVLGALVSFSGLIGTGNLIAFKYLWTDQYRDIALIIGGIFVMCFAQLLILNWTYPYEASVYQFGIALFAVYGIGFPISNTACLGSFSTVQKLGRQATAQSNYALAASLARIIMPILSGFMEQYLQQNCSFSIVLMLVAMSNLAVVLYYDGLCELINRNHESPYGTPTNLPPLLDDHNIRGVFIFVNSMMTLAGAATLIEGAFL